VAELPSGLDSGVLLRRPDVVQAEYQLRAANAQVGAARAALFPRLSLTTVAGLASNGLSRLFTGAAFNYSAAPTISYPIFSGGAGKAAVRQARAQFDAAVATYEKTIQTAFREVADALARRATIGDQAAAQTQLVAASSDNFRLSDARYRGGIDSFLQSLDAQRSLYSARRSLVTTQLTSATNLVTLYRTLGGDALIEADANGPVPVNQPNESPATSE
jgi:multidrug efflux system outer membrane protein